MTFIDTSVFLRFYLKDDEEKASRCRRLFEAIIQGQQRAVTSSLVMAEIVWVLERTYRKSRQEIADFLSSILAMPNLTVLDGPILEQALPLYTGTDIDFIDAYHVALMEHHNIRDIYTYDRHYDRIKDIASLRP